MFTRLRRRAEAIFRVAGFKVMDWPYIQNPASHLVPVLKSSESFEKHALEKLMTHTLHYRQAIKGPTTDYNTTIDLIFTNIQTYKCGIMEAYYTDHKLCWIGW